MKDTREPGGKAVNRRAVVGVVGAVVLLLGATAVGVAQYRESTWPAVEPAGRGAAGSDAAPTSVESVRERHSRLNERDEVAAQDAIAEISAASDLAAGLPSRGKRSTRAKALRRLELARNGPPGGAASRQSGQENGVASLGDNSCLRGDWAQISDSEMRQRPANQRTLHSRSAPGPGIDGQKPYRFAPEYGVECSLFFGSSFFDAILLEGPPGAVVYYAVQTYLESGLQSTEWMQLPSSTDPQGTMTSIMASSLGFASEKSRVMIRIELTDEVLLRDGKCMKCDFRGTSLTGVDLGQVNVSGSDFSGATVYNNTFSRGSDLSGTMWGEFGSTKAVIADIVFDNVSFTAAKLYGTQIVNTTFGESDLTSMLFSGVVIDDSVVFDGAKSTGSGPTFTGSTVSFPGPTLKEGTRVVWANLTFQDSSLLVDSNNSGKLTGALIRDVRLRGTRFLGSSPDLTSTEWVTSEVVESRLGAAKLDKVNLRGANISFTDFSGASMLSADLSGVTANGAVFTDAKMGEATFSQGMFGRGPGGDTAPAIFDRGDLRSSDFRGADLRGTSFREAYVFKGASDPRFGDAHLDRASFDNALLGGAQFDKAVLDDASFRSAQCISCVFTNASVRRVDFRSSYLFGSELLSAQLDGSDFGSADYVTSEPGAWNFTAGIGALAPVVGYLPRSMDDARYASVATCPSGTPPAGNCGGSRGVPQRPPPRPAPCVAAGGEICSLNITTIGGAGPAGYSVGPGGDGLARGAQFNGPTAIVATEGPTGNQRLIVVSDTKNHVVRAIDVVTGKVSLVAGSPQRGGFGGDGGPAVSALLDSPRGLAFDSVGRLYIADAGNNRIRRVDLDGVIVTVAGTGPAGAAGDGRPSTKAQLNGPVGVWSNCTSKGCNLYIADTGNNKVRMVSSNGLMSTIAGTGVEGDSGDKGKALKAALKGPQAVAVDSRGNVYIADTGNNSVRRVAPTGIIGVYKPDFLDQYARPPFKASGVAGVFTNDQDYVYISGTGRNQISRWNVLGGAKPGVVVGDPKGDAGLSGDGGSSRAALVSSPGGVVQTPWGDVVFADTGNNRIRLLSTG